MIVNFSETFTKELIRRGIKKGCTHGVNCLQKWPKDKSGSEFYHHSAPSSPKTNKKKKKVCGEKPSNNEAGKKTGNDREPQENPLEPNTWLPDHKFLSLCLLPCFYSSLLLEYFFFSLSDLFHQLTCTRRIDWRQQKKSGGGG